MEKNRFFFFVWLFLKKFLLVIFNLNKCFRSDILQVKCIIVIHFSLLFAQPNFAASVSIPASASASATAAAAAAAAVAVAVACAGFATVVSSVVVVDAAVAATVTARGKKREKRRLELSLNFIGSLFTNATTDFYVKLTIGFSTILFLVVTRGGRGRGGER